jgi:hypothetical protein
LSNNDTRPTTTGTDEIPGSATALQSLIQSQFTCWAILRSRGRWQRRLISIETQRAPSHQVGSHQSADRSRVYESDSWELEGDRVVKLGKPNGATGRRCQGFCVNLFFRAIFFGSPDLQSPVRWPGVGDSRRIASVTSIRCFMPWVSRSFILPHLTISAFRWAPAGAEPAPPVFGGVGAAETGAHRKACVPRRLIPISFFRFR